MGEIHRNDLADLYDHQRKVFLKSFGIKVIRFENFLVFEEMEYVLARIVTFFGWWEKEKRGDLSTAAGSGAEP